MALATDSQHLNHHTKGCGAGGDSVGSKDVSMPAPRPPPSPPATEAEIETETDTEVEPDSYPFPPFVDVSEQLGETTEYNDDDGAAATERTVPSLNSSHAQENEGNRNNTEFNTQSDVETPVISPVTPPYWTRSSQEHTHSHGHGHGHRRTVSGASFSSVISNPEGLGITLRDNENSSTDDRGSACWAKSVQVTDYVLVNGSKTNIGAFIVWIIRVETLNGSHMNIRKRYSEFDDFRWRLMRTFPGYEAAVPELPPKSFIAKFRPSFLEKRRAGLQYFLHCIMLNPEFSGSPVLKEFLFS